MSGFRTKNQALADLAIEIAESEHPITLRGLFYQIVSAGGLPSTAKVYYTQLGKVVTRLRESGAMPLSYIVDHVRETLKPSSWSGLGDFADTVRGAYRKDFWPDQPDYIEILVEKDAVAATLHEVTERFDVALRVCRGYASLSFIGEIAGQWRHIDKPIYAYYLGDFDPSGFDIERNLREQLQRYAGRDFYWQRLAVDEQDFEDHNLLPLAVKEHDTRAAGFIREHGKDCAELDALAASELRGRVEHAILKHIDGDAWHRLQNVEAVEKESLQDFTDRLASLKVNLDSFSQEGQADAD